MKLLSIGGALALVLGLGAAGCASYEGRHGIRDMHDGGMMGQGMMGGAAQAQCPRGDMQGGQQPSGAMGGMSEGQMGGQMGSQMGGQMGGMSREQMRARSGDMPECPPEQHQEHHPDEGETPSGN